MQKTEKNIKILGIYQIIGGILGTALTLYFSGKAGILNFPILKMTIVFLSFYSFSIYCGILLVKKNYVRGLNLSIINQILQIISFSVLGFTFAYTSGMFISFGLNLTTDTLLTYNMGLTTFNFKWNADPEYAAVSINIIALILLNVSFNLKEKITKGQKDELSEIGQS
ncbi:hypothetical protein [Flavobacterium sp. KACC 22761]|uniref:hypothetical protein n=1 Tax=Flavobacterium sp. KACC 22761 TaxID=3092665 RepID=UPI002A757257|nr:hypothetical protein [Flavobacterium sp. KACC 22761]WPO77179.1 hypothetical protein SCB73_12995 [Flavobacterium sp. KACC 22761]